MRPNLVYTIANRSLPQWMPGELLKIYPSTVPLVTAPIWPQRRLRNDPEYLDLE